MTSVTFTVLHEPIGQPRHRSTVRNGQVRLYLPGRHPVHAFKRAVKAAYLVVRGKKHLQGPLSITLACLFPRPKSKVWKTKPMESYWHTAKPDFDNVTKAVCDALNGLAWDDDSQIAAANITKRVVGCSVPRVVITIEELGE